MNTNESTQKSPWGNAIVAAILIVAVLFLLFSRSSCSKQLQEAQHHAAAAESSDGGEEVSDDNSNATAVSATDTSVNGESDSVIPEEAPEPDAATLATDGEIQEDAPASSDVASTSSREVSNSPAEGDPSTAESGSEGKPVGQSIGGLTVRGERLGVILDVSGSMTRYLDDLRSEIKAGFSGALFLEVEGCLLEPVQPDEDESHTGVRRHSVMNAVFELAAVHRVDSIYWFCDLQDTQTVEALEELRSLALGKSSHSAGFRLYVRSTDEEPSTVLEDLIRLSGGAYERRR